MKRERERDADVYTHVMSERKRRGGHHCQLLPAS
jgi:hypothetical protein